MADRQRFALLSALIVVVVSVPTPAAQSLEVMTAVPVGAVLAAMDLDQAPPDAACAAQCQRVYDADMKSAARKLSEKLFRASGQGDDCDTRWNTKTNACAATFQACDGPCGTYQADCKRPCLEALQTCCHANVVANAAHGLEQCVAKCPASKAPVTPPSPPPPTPPTPKKPIDREAAWKSMVNNTAAMLQAFGGMQLEGLTPERFDAMRRELAFTQVTADMMAKDATYGVLAGGNGRLWAIRNDGTRFLLAFPKPTGDEGADWDALRRAIKQQTGLENFQVNNLLKVIDSARERKDLAPGTYYMCRAFDNTTASSEHASIRGTINGGGEFI